MSHETWHWCNVFKKALHEKIKHFIENVKAGEVPTTPTTKTLLRNILLLYSVGSIFPWEFVGTTAKFLGKSRSFFYMWKLLLCKQFVQLDRNTWRKNLIWSNVYDGFFIFHNVITCSSIISYHLLTMRQNYLFPRWHFITLWVLYLPNLLTEYGYYHIFHSTYSSWLWPYRGEVIITTYFQ